MIVCAGEALIDMLPRETASGEEAFAPYAGGAVYNTAIALGRLGAPAGYFGGLSSDLFGTLLADRLTEAGVSPTLAVRSEKPTTLAFVELENGQASYTFYDENSAGRMLAPEDLPDLDDGVEALFFGGISLVAEPCGSAFEALMAAAAPTRAIMIDPNIRPSFVTDEDAYRARLLRMLAMADIVKVSDEDLQWLFGSGSHADQGRALVAQGVSVVCVTEGAMGVTGYHATGSIRVGAEKVEVVDTVGAGDTFNAGLMAALHASGVLTKEKLAEIDHPTLAAALRYGARAAAVTVSRAGANPPTRDEL
ncbi:MAG: carbohydrate kinase [Pseudomonadota bacterium]